MRVGGEAEAIGSRWATVCAGTWTSPSTARRRLAQSTLRMGRVRWRRERDGRKRREQGQPISYVRLPRIITPFDIVPLGLPSICFRRHLYPPCIYAHAHLRALSLLHFHFLTYFISFGVSDPHLLPSSKRISYRLSSPSVSSIYSPHSGSRLTAANTVAV